MAHIKTLAFAAAFGLCAYAVVRFLVYVTGEIGLLQWMAS